MALGHLNLLRGYTHGRRYPLPTAQGGSIVAFSGGTLVKAAGIVIESSPLQILKSTAASFRDTRSVPWHLTRVKCFVAACGVLSPLLPVERTKQKWYWDLGLVFK